VRVLVTGWFSFDEVIATVGDELGADTVAGWLDELGIRHDVAWAPFLARGVHWRDVDPADYTHLVFVSGPIGDRPLLQELCAAFRACQRWAVNVSVVDERARTLFDQVWARDAPGAEGRAHVARGDLAIDAGGPDAPVVAVAFAPVQSEYGAGPSASVRSSSAGSRPGRCRGSSYRWTCTTSRTHGARLRWNRSCGGPTSSSACDCTAWSSA
jgi:hypothetical protein